MTDTEFESYLLKLKSSYEPIRNKIHSIEERNEYLRQCNDNYTLFILDKLAEKPNLNVAGELIEIHHIIPKACGGPETEWNKMRLTYSEHEKAHELRFQAYKEENDRRALLFRKNVNDSQRRAFLKKSLVTRREKK